MRATSSLPVPDSPEMCTGAWLRDTRRIISRSRSIDGPLPMSCVPVRVDAPRVRRLRELERGGDDAAQDAEVERLRDEIERAELQRAHRGLDVAVRGDDGAGHAGAVRRHPFEQVEAVAVRQAHVGQAQVEALGLEQLLCAGRRRRRTASRAACASA